MKHYSDRTKETRNILRKLAQSGANVVAVYRGSGETGSFEVTTHVDKLGFRENLSDEGFGYYLRNQGNKIPLKAVTSVFQSPINGNYYLNIDWHYVYINKPKIDCNPTTPKNLGEVMEAIGWQH